MHASLLLPCIHNHRGRVPVNNDDVIELYGGTHVPIYIMDDHHHRYGLEIQPKLLQFLDSFSLAEMSLLVDVSDVRSIIRSFSRSLILFTL